MSDIRHRILELQPALEPLMASVKWDPALMGYARRAQETRPVYSWHAARALDKQSLENFSDESASSLILHTGRNWRDTWRVALRSSVCRWAQLDKAVLGIGVHNGERALIYSMPLAVDLLRRSQMESEASVDPTYSAILFIEDRLLPADFGPTTAWFMTPVQ